MDSNIDQNKYRGQMISRAIAANMQNFSIDEINRVFDPVVAPDFCKKVFLEMIQDGFTEHHLKTLTKFTRAIDDGYQVCWVIWALVNDLDWKEPVERVAGNPEYIEWITKEKVKYNGSQGVEVDFTQWLVEQHLPATEWWYRRKKI